MITASRGSKTGDPSYAAPIDDPLFSVAVVVMGVLIVGIFLAIGRYHPRSGAEVLDWKPTRSYETEIELEIDDVDQMLEAQNERRRRTGRPELSEDEVRSEVAAEERAQEERAAQIRRERGDEDE
jgi:hypothetical protein